MAKQQGHLTFFCLLDHLTATICKLRPDVVAYSVNVLGYRRTIEAHKKASKIHNFVSIMGGPQATFSPETFPESGMDAYCIGEGEYPFRDFLAKVEHGDSFDGIENLITKKGANPVRPLIGNLDDLPPADRDLVISNSFLKDVAKKTFYASRGCPFKCLPTGTRVLTEGIQWQNIEDIREGTIIYGVEKLNGRFHYSQGVVTHLFHHKDFIYGIETANGTVFSTIEHPWLMHDKWKSIQDLIDNIKYGQKLDSSRCVLRKLSSPQKPYKATDDYRIGYIAGALAGDGSFHHSHFLQHYKDKIYERDYFLLSMTGDDEMLNRTVEYGQHFGLSLHLRKYNPGVNSRFKRLNKMVACDRYLEAELLYSWVYKPNETIEYKRGFLAGIYDAEGSWSGGNLRISNQDIALQSRIKDYLYYLGIDSVIEERAVRIGQLSQQTKFVSMVCPSVTRKQSLLGKELCSSIPIKHIEPVGFNDVFNLETTTGNFIADGFVTHNCTYCCNNYYRKLYQGKGPPVRRFSVERVIQEIEDVGSKYRMSFIKFGDDCFILKADDWLEEFSEKYHRRIGIPFNCYLRLDTVNDTMLKLLKRAGCFSVHLSVDSASPYIRETILKRQMRSENVVERLREIRQYGINTWVNYMLAVPESSLQDDLDSIKLSKDGRVTYPAYSTTVPMEKTELYGYCVKQGLIDPTTYVGDMTGCSQKSALSCFTEKEKSIRYNIYLLGAFIAKLPYPLDKIAISLIKVIPPNTLFRKINNWLYSYYIKNKIFKLPGEKIRGQRFSV